MKERSALPVSSALRQRINERNKNNIGKKKRGDCKINKKTVDELKPAVQAAGPEDKKAENNPVFRSQRKFSSGIEEFEFPSK